MWTTDSAVRRLAWVTLLVATLIVTARPTRGQPPQPGATQGGPTTGDEMQPPFDPRYYLGRWEIEWTPPDTPLLPGGAYTGTETVTHISNRFLKVTVEMEGEEGNVVHGEGLILYEYALGGQSVVKYVHYDAGFSLLQYGPIGGDLGGYYSAFWETPAFEYDGRTVALRGRSYYVSPAAYRVNQEISVDGDDFFNFGIMWLTKDLPANQER